MTWTPLDLVAGVDKDNSPLEAGKRGRYTDADKVRFVDDLPETIPGWEKVTGTAITGICRGMFAWQDNSHNPLAALGTHLRLYAMDIDGNLTDTTPATSYAQSSISFTTVITSTTVTITGWTHGLIVDQKFKLENATVATVGGVTINGTYTVLTVESVTSITFTAASAATSSAGPTASTVDITTYLAPGQIDGLGGLGAGVGGAGIGGAGGSSSGVSYFPRTWALAQWGQNLLANPREGAIYEWAPNVTASELVANGNFSTSAQWTMGAGWSVGGGVAQLSSGSATDLYTNLTLATGAYNLVTFTFTRTGGTLLPKHGTTTIGSGALSASGLYRLPFYANGGSDTLVFSKDATGAGSISNVSVKVLTTAQILPNAPTQVGSMFVSDQRQVVACGSNLDGSYDPLQVDWCDTENNQTWATLASNLAGGFALPSGSRIVRGQRGSRENVLWTKTSLWSMRFTGNPNSIYDFQEMGSGCGLVGPNAAAEINGVWYWVTPEGSFMAYSGAAPVMVPCTLSRDVKDHLANVQGEKVYATPVIAKTYAEVWWFYPDIRDGNECSRYVIFDTVKGTWSCGTFNRTAWSPAPGYAYPIAVDTSGYIWFQEKGFDQDGGARSWRVRAAYQRSPQGQITLNGIKPDADDLQGGYTITPYIINSDVRGQSTRTYPAMNVNGTSGDKSCRVKGEQVALEWAGNDAPTFWRMGNTLVDIQTGGSR